MTWSGVTVPEGFRATGVAAGIKPKGLDVALVAAEGSCTAAGVFTTNRVRAAPVLVSREHLGTGTLRAVVVNSGCANAATGAQGLADAREMSVLAAQAVGCEPGDVAVCSTGVIGVHLPMANLRDGIARAGAALSRDGGNAAAQALMTTDTHSKEAVARVDLGGHPVHVGGMAKGSGMIAPRMATMLAVLTTDASIAADLLGAALGAAVATTFNRITVDGDPSTHDTVLLLASGRAGAPRIDSRGPAFDAFSAVLLEVCHALAQQLIHDGEGATRVAEIRVEQAPSTADAERIARTVAESPLVKTALFGKDANWGRILAAAGRAGVEFDPGLLDIHLGDVWVAEKGCVRAYDEGEATMAVSGSAVTIRLVLHAGAASASVWTTDLSHGYVEINGSYRS